MHPFDEKPRRIKLDPEPTWVEKTFKGTVGIVLFIIAVLLTGMAVYMAYIAVSVLVGGTPAAIGIDGEPAGVYRPPPTDQPFSNPRPLLRPFF